MRFKSKFDARKAIEVLLYIAARVPDMYKALKVLYFADLEHLQRYGRQICGDSYVAMRHGPVPSGAYDLVKLARGEGLGWADYPIREDFAVQDVTIIPRREANLALLSASDVECLDLAIERVRPLSFGQLRQLSHDAAFAASDENDYMPLESIVRTLPNAALLLDYLRNGQGE